MPSAFLQLDKATQTDESCFAERNLGKSLSDNSQEIDSPSDRMEKIVKHRYQPRYNYGRTCEHSVSSQTLSPVHGKLMLVKVMRIFYDFF